MSERNFVVTNDHIRLLKAMYWRWADYETGAPAVDGKRPYGNSDVAGDVAKILEWEVDEDEGLTLEQEERALELHAETLPAIQQILNDLPLLAVPATGEPGQQEGK